MGDIRCLVRLRDDVIIRSHDGCDSTMLIVTHETAFARDVSNRILFLDQGRVAAEGPPDVLMGGGASECFDQFISRFKHG